MDFGSLVGSAGSFATNASNAIQAFHGTSAPVAVSPQSTAAVSVGRRDIDVAEGVGMTFGGIAIVYFVLRWLGLLPRFLRII